MAKRPLPKTIVKKRIAKSVFWVLAGYMLFSVTLMWMRPAGEVAQAVMQDDDDVTPAFTVGIETFAVNFAHHYFTWEPGREAADQRRERLSSYLVNGLHPQAGLITDNLKSSATHQKSQMWKIDDAGDSKSLITMRSQYTQSIGANGEHATTKLVYWVIPVATDGENYAVYDTPYFIPEPKQADIELQEDRDPTAVVRNPDLSNEIKVFLESFFNVYASGRTEELSYYTLDVEDIGGLEGILEFDSIEGHEIYALPDDNAYAVYTKVILADATGSTRFTYPFGLEVKKQDNRWFVIGFDK
ncbi:conjugal transfer protein [Paenibacillus sp. 1P07SE]|uniref:conjugal transfer protein n=1 Tax=Paenibacillus sp. 1P07SE TaxID=3132209 RepID=UPI0039A54DED